MANPDKFVEIGGTRFRVEEEGAWLGMGIEHERIHLGQVYSAGTMSSALANGGTILVVLKAGAAQPHMIWDVAVGGNSTLRVIEGGAVAGSASTSIYNRNRGSTNAPGGTVVTGGTLTGGAVLQSVYLPGGSGGLRSGGAARSDSEWVGEENTAYVFEVVNASGGNAGVSIALEWYEVSED